MEGGEPSVTPPTQRRGPGRPRKDGLSPISRKRKGTSRGRGRGRVPVIDDDDDMPPAPVPVPIPVSVPNVPPAQPDYKSPITIKSEGEPVEVRTATDQQFLPQTGATVDLPIDTGPPPGDSFMTFGGGDSETMGSDIRCAFCCCGEKSLLGQGDMTRYDPTPGFNPFKRRIDRTQRSSTEAAGDQNERSPKQHLTWRRQRGPGKASRDRSKSPRRSNPHYESETGCCAVGMDELSCVGRTEEVDPSVVFEPSGHTWAHHCCAAWSEGVCLDDNGILINVDKAVFSGITQKCSYCKRFGATILCRNAKCNKLFHYPCAAGAGAFQDIKTMSLLCPDHLEEAETIGENACCVICDLPGDISDQLFCTSCGQHYHCTCLDPPVEINPVVRAGWQCPECKICQTCRQPGDDSKMLVCDTCDKGYHTFCLKPAMNTIPKNGWKCKNCRVCGDCGSRTPGSGPSSRWHLNYSVCDSCYQQRNKGLYCPVCGKAYRHFTQKEMLQCDGCRKWIHAECDDSVDMATYQQMKETECHYEYLCPVCKNKDDSDVPYLSLSPQAITGDAAAATGNLSSSSSTVTSSEAAMAEAELREMEEMVAKGEDLGEAMDDIVFAAGKKEGGMEMLRTAQDPLQSSHDSLMSTNEDSFSSMDVDMSASQQGPLYQPHFWHPPEPSFFTEQYRPPPPPYDYSPRTYTQACMLRAYASLGNVPTDSLASKTSASPFLSALLIQSSGASTSAGTRSSMAPLPIQHGSGKPFGKRKLGPGRPRQGRGAGAPPGRKRQKHTGPPGKRGPKPKFKQGTVALPGTVGGPGTEPSPEKPSKSSKNDDEDEGMHTTVVLFSTDDKFTLMQDMCVSCGSFGQGAEGRLLSCSQCGQCYHPYCVNIKITKVVLSKGWRCLDCTVCEGCGKASDEGRLLLCDDCDVSYHIYCLDPPLTKVPKGGWRCKWCVCCTQCGATSPGYNCKWQNNYTQCGPCAAMVTCPLCQQNYHDEELIIQCSQCERWLHSECDGMQSEDEAERAADAGYHCVMCRPRTQPSPAHLPPTSVHSGTADSKGPASHPFTRLAITEPEAKPRPPQEFSVEGVLLTETGLRQIESLSITPPPKQKRVRRRPRLAAAASLSLLHSLADPKSEVSQALEQGEAGDSKDANDPDFDPGPEHHRDEQGDESMELSTADPTKPGEGGAKQKRKYRRGLRPGIGGFFARHRTRPSFMGRGRGAVPRTGMTPGLQATVARAPPASLGEAGNFADAPEEEQLLEAAGPAVAVAAAAAVPAVPAPEGPLSGKVVRPKRKRKRKPGLKESYPEYLQEAFFGKSLLDTSRTKDGQVNLDTPSDEERGGTSQGPMMHQPVHPAGGEGFPLPAPGGIAGQQPPQQAPFLANQPPHTDHPHHGEMGEAGEIEMTEDDPLGLLPHELPHDDEIMSVLMGEDLGKATEGLDLDSVAVEHTENSQGSQNGDGENESDPSKENNLDPQFENILSPAALDKMVTEGLAEMDSKDVEDLFSEVLSPESREQQGTPTQGLSGTPTTSSQDPGFPLGHPMAPPMPQPHPGFHDNMPRPPPPTNLPIGGPPFPLPSQPGFPQDFTRGELGSPFSPSFEPPSPWPAGGAPPPEGEQGSTAEGMTRNQFNVIKWEKEEQLGDDATISAVLYANMQHPELKQQYPDWPTRAKAIAKLWRKVTPEEKQPFLQRAKDNRAKMKSLANKGLQHLSNNSNTPPSTPAPQTPPIMPPPSPLTRQPSDPNLGMNQGPNLGIVSSPGHPGIVSNQSRPPMGSSPNHPAMASSPSHPGMVSSPSHPGMVSSPNHPVVCPNPNQIAMGSSPNHPAMSPNHPPMGSSPNHPGVGGNQTLSLPGMCPSPTQPGIPPSLPRMGPNPGMGRMGGSAGRALTEQQQRLQKEQRQAWEAEQEQKWKQLQQMRAQQQKQQQQLLAEATKSESAELRENKKKRLEEESVPEKSGPNGAPTSQSESSMMPPPPLPPTSDSVPPSSMAQDTFAVPPPPQADSTDPFVAPKAPAPRARSLSLTNQPDDPYARMPGTPRPSSQDPYAVQPGTPRPRSNSDSFVSRPPPEDPYSHMPGTPRPAPSIPDDPYAKMPGTPRPGTGNRDPFQRPPLQRSLSDDPYAKMPGTPRPGPQANPFVRPSMPVRRASADDQFSQMSQRPQLPPDDPYASMPGTPRPPPQTDSFIPPLSQPSDPYQPSPVQDDPYAKMPGTPRPGPSRDPFKMPAAPRPPNQQDPLMPPPGRPPFSQASRPVGPSGPFPKPTLPDNDPYAQQPGTPRPTQDTDPFSPGPVGLQNAPFPPRMGGPQDPFGPRAGGMMSPRQQGPWQQQGGFPQNAPFDRNPGGMGQPRPVMERRYHLSQQGRVFAEGMQGQGPVMPADSQHALKQQMGMMGGNNQSAMQSMIEKRQQIRELLRQQQERRRQRQQMEQVKEEQFGAQIPLRHWPPEDSQGPPPPYAGPHGPTSTTGSTMLPESWGGPGVPPQNFPGDRPPQPGDMHEPFLPGQRPPFMGGEERMRPPFLPRGQMFMNPRMQAQFENRPDGQMQFPRGPGPNFPGQQPGDDMQANIPLQLRHPRGPFPQGPRGQQYIELKRPDEGPVPGGLMGERPRNPYIQIVQERLQQRNLMMQNQQRMMGPQPRHPHPPPGMHPPTSMESFDPLGRQNQMVETQAKFPFENNGAQGNMNQMGPRPFPPGVPHPPFTSASQQFPSMPGRAPDNQGMNPQQQEQQPQQQSGQAPPTGDDTMGGQNLDPSHDDLQDANIDDELFLGGEDFDILQYADPELDKQQMFNDIMGDPGEEQKKEKLPEEKKQGEEDTKVEQPGTSGSEQTTASKNASNPEHEVTETKDATKQESPSGEAERVKEDVKPEVDKKMGGEDAGKPEGEVQGAAGNSGTEGAQQNQGEVKSAGPSQQGDGLKQESPGDSTEGKPLSGEAPQTGDQLQDPSTGQLLEQDGTPESGTGQHAEGVTKEEPTVASSCHVTPGTSSIPGPNSDLQNVGVTSSAVVQPPSCLQTSMAPQGGPPASGAVQPGVPGGAPVSIAMPTSSGQGLMQPTAGQLQGALRLRKERRLLLEEQPLLLEDLLEQERREQEQQRQQHQQQQPGTWPPQPTTPVSEPPPPIQNQSPTPQSSTAQPQAPNPNQPRSIKEMMLQFGQSGPASLFRNFDTDKMSQMSDPIAKAKARVLMKISQVVQQIQGSGPHAQMLQAMNTMHHLQQQQQGGGGQQPLQPGIRPPFLPNMPNNPGNGQPGFRPNFPAQFQGGNGQFGNNGEGFNIGPQPPVPFPNGPNGEIDPQQQRQYEEWLFQHQQLLQMQQKMLEAQVGKQKKQKKSLAARQRQQKKNGQELSETDENQLKAMTEQQSVLQKQLQQVREQQKKHSLLIQEYRMKQRERAQEQQQSLQQSGFPPQPMMGPNNSPNPMMPQRMSPMIPPGQHSPLLSPRLDQSPMRHPTPPMGQASPSLGAGPPVPLPGAQQQFSEAGPGPAATPQQQAQQQAQRMPPAPRVVLDDNNPFSEAFQEREKRERMERLREQQERQRLQLQQEIEQQRRLQQMERQDHDWHNQEVVQNNLTNERRQGMMELPFFNTPEIPDIAGQLQPNPNPQQQQQPPAQQQGPPFMGPGQGQPPMGQGPRFPPGGPNFPPGGPGSFPRSPLMHPRMPFPGPMGPMDPHQGFPVPPNYPMSGTPPETEKPKPKRKRNRKKKKSADNEEPPLPPQGMPQDIPQNQMPHPGMVQGNPMMPPARRDPSQPPLLDQSFTVPLRHIADGSQGQLDMNKHSLLLQHLTTEQKDALHLSATTDSMPRPDSLDTDKLKAEMGPQKADPGSGETEKGKEEDGEDGKGDGNGDGKKDSPEKPAANQLLKALLQGTPTQNLLAKAGLPPCKALQEAQDVPVETSTPEKVKKEEQDDSDDEEVINKLKLTPEQQKQLEMLEQMPETVPKSRGERSLLEHYPFSLVTSHAVVGLLKYPCRLLKGQNKWPTLNKKKEWDPKSLSSLPPAHSAPDVIVREQEEFERRRQEYQQQLKKRKETQTKRASKKRKKDEEDEITKMKQNRFPSTEMIMSTVKQLSLCEPEISVNFALFPPYGSGPLNGDNQLKGTFGHAFLDGVQDYYSNFLKSETLSNPPTPPASLPPTPPPPEWRDPPWSTAICILMRSWAPDGPSCMSPASGKLETEPEPRRYQLLPHSEVSMTTADELMKEMVSHQRTITRAENSSVLGMDGSKPQDVNVPPSLPTPPPSNLAPGEAPRFSRDATTPDSIVPSSSPESVIDDELPPQPPKLISLNTGPNRGPSPTIPLIAPTPRRDYSDDISKPGLPSCQLTLLKTLSKPKPISTHHHTVSLAAVPPPRATNPTLIIQSVQHRAPQNPKLTPQTTQAAALPPCGMPRHKSADSADPQTRRSKVQGIQPPPSTIQTAQLAFQLSEPGKEPVSASSSSTSFTVVVVNKTFLLQPAANTKLRGLPLVDSLPLPFAAKPPTELAQLPRDHPAPLATGQSSFPTSQAGVFIQPTFSVPQSVVPPNTSTVDIRTSVSMPRTTDAQVTPAFSRTSESAFSVSNLERMRTLVGQAGGPLPPQRPDGNMSVSLTLSATAAEDINGIVAAVADLVRVPVPTSYEISEGADYPSSMAEHFRLQQQQRKADGVLSTCTQGVSLETLLQQGKPKFCRHCDVVVQGDGIRKASSDFPFLRDQEGRSDQVRTRFVAQDSSDSDSELTFCSPTCLMQFAISLQSRARRETKEKAGSIVDHRSRDIVRPQHSEIPIHLSPTYVNNTSKPFSEGQGSEGKSERPRLKRRSDSNTSQTSQDLPPEPPKVLIKKWKGVRWRRWEVSIMVPKSTYRPPSEKEIDELMSKLGTCLKPDDLPVDSRCCVLCGRAGDGDTEAAARLLNMDLDMWVHLNCALWSTEVYETLNGALINVEMAYKRGQTLACTACNKIGATITCHRYNCKRIYHLICAIKENCMFFKDKTVMCPVHAPNKHENELVSLSVFRRVYVNRDESKQIAKIMRNYGEKKYTLRVGSLIFHNVGQLLPHQLQAFHTRTAIYPIGFEVTRLYWSMRYANKRCRYVCRVEENQGRPQLVIRVIEQGHEDVVFKGATPKLVWLNILEPIEKMRRGSDVLKLFPNFITGEDLFGLTEPAVLRIVESLPGTEMLQDYFFRYGRHPLIELPLAINPTGCARSEPKMRTYIRRPHTLTSSNTSRSSQTTLTGELLSPYHKQFAQSKSAQYRKLKQEWRNNVVLGRSRIQGLGLFAARDIDKHVMVIEYIGVIIRNEVCNKRERIYEDQNRGVYMFRIDSELVIDATLAGGPARYINHSCNPNCVAEVVNFEKEQKIIIISSRRLSKGEELTYDYKFDIEDDEQKIPCCCGAPNCRKWMN
ncbi:histone-lysine N-methyltransferase 2C-like [Branchiostoma floridae x Branchiostoma belcheri]